MRGVRPSEVPGPLPGPWPNWLPLPPGPLKSNEIKVRASPQAVGVRVSTPTPDCRTLIDRKCSRDRAAMPVPAVAVRVAALYGQAPPSVPAAKPGTVWQWECRRAPRALPLLPGLVVLGLALAGPP